MENPLEQRMEVKWKGLSFAGRILAGRVSRHALQFESLLGTGVPMKVILPVNILNPKP